MDKKYEIKTYSNGTKSEILSDLETMKKNVEIDNNKNNKTDSEQNVFLGTTFQPKSFLSKQNNNISFFQSTSNSTNRSSKNNKYFSLSIDNKNSTNQNSTAMTSTQSFGEEKFSYNFTSLKGKIKENENKDDNKNAERINIEELNSKIKKPKRTIKSYQKQYNIQKGDNFNMLSYRPMECNSDNNMNLNKGKTKTNQIYKKQEVDEICYPSKKTYSPQTTIQKENGKKKYQTHSLKYQSFFGSFNGYKNSRVTKSTSKMKINQLNEFNIDKLIEIGDKYANLKKPVLPLGKIMNNNIMYHNKVKYNNKIPNSKIYSKYSYDAQPISDFSKYTKKSTDKYLLERKENNINYINEKKRVTKKRISKKSFKNTKTVSSVNTENKEDIPVNSIMRNIDFNTEVDNNDNNINLNQVKKHHSKKYTKDTQTLNEFYQNIVGQNNQPNPKPYKRKTYIILNKKHNETSFQNKIEDNNLINKTKIGKQINNNNILTDSKILTEEEKNYKNKILYKINNMKNKEILINENTNNNYKINNRMSSKIYYKDTNPKTYYGYDERHNLENTIDNNAFYESKHSKKKLRNLANDKVK